MLIRGIINLTFSRDFFQGGKNYCLANFFCDANFSIVFDQNFMRGASGFKGVPRVGESQYFIGGHKPGKNGQPENLRNLKNSLNL